MDSQGNASQWLFKDELDAVPLKVEDLLKDIIENGLYGREDEFKEMAKNGCSHFFLQREQDLRSYSAPPWRWAPVRQIYSAKDDGNFLLQDSLRLLAKGYDVTIIDTPPGIDVSTIGTVAAADYLLIPVTPDPLAMHGARDTLSYVYTKAARHFNPFIKVLGLVITMVDKSSTARFGIDIVREAFGDYHVFESQIRTSARVRALPGKQKTLYQANPNERAGPGLRRLAARYMNESWQTKQTSMTSRS